MRRDGYNTFYKLCFYPCQWLAAEGIVFVSSLKVKYQGYKTTCDQTSTGEAFCHFVCNISGRVFQRNLS